MRRHYLDNIRWATVVLVVIYHAFYLFNACGVFGGIGQFAEVQPQDALMTFVYPWFMVLLFTVAGMSARYALEKKSAGAFVKGRTLKLLVPSTLGLLVYHWLCGFFYMNIGGGMEEMSALPVPVIYLIAAFSGTGPLWFAQVLWLFSLVLALIRKLDREDRLWRACGKVHPALIVPLGLLLLWGGAQVGNMPVITTYRFGIYGVAVLLGYLFLSHEKPQQLLERCCVPLLAAALVTGAAYVVSFFGQDFTADGCLRSYFTNLYAWIAVLAVLGCGKAWADRTSPFAGYMSRSSFGVYVLHYLPTLLTAWALYTFTALPPAVIYPLCAAAGLGGGLALWELFRRIPVLRWAVLGIGGGKTT